MSRLPQPPTPAPPRQNTMTGLAPGFLVKLRATLAQMHFLGFDATPFETLRTDERQTYLYGFGRWYDDGRGIVTHSQDADETWHHFGLACDVVSATQGWNAPSQFWSQLGQCAIRCGLAWGGQWHRPDLPHVQFGSPMRPSPSPRAARLFAAGGFEAVWTAVGAS